MWSCPAVRVRVIFSSLSCFDAIVVPGGPACIILLFMVYWCCHAYYNMIVNLVHKSTTWNFYCVAMVWLFPVHFAYHETSVIFNWLTFIEISLMIEGPYAWNVRLYFPYPQTTPSIVICIFRFLSGHCLHVHRTLCFLLVYTYDIIILNFFCSF